MKEPCLGMNAQIASDSNARVQTEKKVSEKMWYVRGGLNVNKLVGDGADGTERKIGYDFTFGFQKPIGSLGLYWGMELGLGTRGCKGDDVYYDFNEDDYYYLSLKLPTHNVHCSPLTLGYGYAVNDKIRLEAHLGAFVSYDYAGKAKVTLKDEYGNKYKESVSLGDLDDDLGIEWKRFDAGLKLGAGIWYDRYNLDFTWKRGFVEAVEDGECFSNSFMLRVGVAF